jgi:hypothetical protein
MYFYCYVYVPTGTLRLPWPRFFLSCKAKALFQNFCVVPRIVCFVSFCVLIVCKCVMYYRHRVETQLQLPNIYIILFFHGNTGYANAPKSYVYTYIAFLLVTVCQEYGPSGTHAPIITNLLQTKTSNEPLENGVFWVWDKPFASLQNKCALLVVSQQLYTCWQRKTFEVMSVKCNTHRISSWWW